MVIIYRKSAMMPIDGRAAGVISITNRSVMFFAKTPGNPLAKTLVLRYILQIINTYFPVMICVYPLALAVQVV